MTILFHLKKRLSMTAEEEKRSAKGNPAVIAFFEVVGVGYRARFLRASQLYIPAIIPITPPGISQTGVLIIGCTCSHLISMTQTSIDECTD